VNHACSVAAKRQMIVTGGLNPAAANQSELIYSRDIWTQGIGVFDLTAMQWKDKYDVNAAPYKTPDAVKSWYAANGRHPAQWDDPVVEGFFTQSGKQTIDPSLSGNAHILQQRRAARASPVQIHQTKLQALAGPMQALLLEELSVVLPVWH
jgi:hypothetical protein